MLLALIRLESPAGCVFKNGTENLNGGFVLKRSAILAVLESKSLSSCRMETTVGGRCCCCSLIFPNPEVLGLFCSFIFFFRERKPGSLQRAHWVMGVPVET